MQRSMIAVALLWPLLAGGVDGPAAPDLTWQEANKRSAALIREKGPSPEAADLARRAFDLYPEQTRSYNATNHAQLLLNAVDARSKAEGTDAALQELDRGAAAISAAGAQESDVLIVIWEEGARIAGRGGKRAAKYTTLALQQAEKLLGPDHPRTIALQLDLIHDQRGTKGATWALTRYEEARERALKAGPDSKQVTEIDLQLAKLALESGKTTKAIEAYRALIDRLEQRSDPDQATYLQLAYAQLELAYDEKRDPEAAAQVRSRRLAHMARDERALMPTVRIAPEYPQTALRDGREGFVLMEMRINPDGTVADARIIRSEPGRVFDDAAMRAIRKWKFQPKIVEGQPVETTGTQMIEFRLDRRRDN